MRLPKDRKSTESTSANVTIIRTTLTIYNGRLDTALHIQSAVSDNVSASGLTRTSDFLSATVAKSIKICIFGFTRMMINDINSMKKTAPTLPKNGMISATNPKLACKRSLLASIMFTVVFLLFKPKVLHVFGTHSFWQRPGKDLSTEHTRGVP